VKEEQLKSHFFGYTPVFLEFRKNGAQKIDLSKMHSQINVILIKKFIIDENRWHHLKFFDQFKKSNF
jgi:hypothetical protein